MSLQIKIDRAIRLLRSVKVDEIEVCYSGGKDSDVILELAKMAGIPYRAIYKNTTIDPPGTIAHCKSKGVEVMAPKMTFFELIAKKGFPTRRARFCCEVLKEYKVLDYAIQGIRRCESTARAERYDEPIICRIYGKKSNHVNVILPILDWSNADVAEFIKLRNIECHPLYYDEAGRFVVTRRLGCVGCPLKADGGLLDFKNNPRMVKALIKAGRKFFGNRKMPNPKFKSAEHAFIHNIFFKSYEDFRLATFGGFFNKGWFTGRWGTLHAKQFLENYFKIKL